MHIHKENEKWYIIEYEWNEYKKEIITQGEEPTEEEINIAIEEIKLEKQEEKQSDIINKILGLLLIKGNGILKNGNLAKLIDLKNQKGLTDEKIDELIAKIEQKLN